MIGKFKSVIIFGYNSDLYLGYKSKMIPYLDDINNEINILNQIRIKKCKFI